MVSIQRPKVKRVSASEAKSPDILTRGSALGPHWRHSPQTPVSYPWDLHPELESK